MAQVRVVITDLAPHIHEVRLINAGNRHFHASFNLTELDDGRLLRVSMFSARAGTPPPGVQWFKAFAAEHYPNAERVTSDRLGEDGERRPWMFRFRPSPIEVLASALLFGGRL